MTFESLKREINKYTYKPGVSLSIYEILGPEDSLKRALLTVHSVFSVDGPNDKSGVVLYYEDLNNSHVKDMVRSLILSYEQDKMNYFLKYKGKQVVKSKIFVDKFSYVSFGSIVKEYEGKRLPSRSFSKSK